MNVQPVSTNANFEGKLIIKNKINSAQNHLLNLHKQNLEKMIDDLPFDLFVEQSKSRKTISISTNVEGAGAYIVHKNKQDFEQAAGYAISDAKQKSEAYKKLMKVTEMFENSKNALVNVFLGKFKDARKCEKELAKTAVEDFDAYKSIPNVSVTNVPWFIFRKLIINIFKYRVYKAFSKKIPEEKRFMELKKEYLDELKKENKEIKTVKIELPRLY